MFASATVFAAVMLPGSISPAGAQGPDDTVPTTAPVSDDPAVPTSAVPTTSPAPPEKQPLPGQATVTEPMSRGGGLNNILPRPNSGHAPDYQGDRGSGSQYAVLGAMVLALGVILALVARQSRRSRAQWSATAPMATLPAPTQDDPAPTQDVPASDAPASGGPAPVEPAPDGPTTGSEA